MTFLIKVLYTQYTHEFSEEWKMEDFALYQVIWVLLVNRLSNSNSTSVQKTNKAMATKCNRVVTQEKRRKSIGEGRENCISGASRSLLHL